MKDCRTGKANRLKSGNQRRRYLLPLIVVFIGICTAGGIAAKYRTDQQKQAEAIAAEFHFTSDLLEEKMAEYQITNWSSGFDIQLYNYEKENMALVSNEDISYNVIVEPADKWQCEDGLTGKLTGKSSAKNTLNIHPKSGAVINQKDEVTVTVKSTAPFSKELSAKFILASKSMPENQLVSNSKDENQWRLTVRTNDYSGMVNISWPKDELCPDNTNEYMSKWKNDGSETLEVKANTTYELVFLRSTEGTAFQLYSGSGSGTDISIEKQ